jgi:hypothetical protein
MSFENYNTPEDGPALQEKEGVFCIENLRFHFDEATRKLIDNDSLERTLSEILPDIDRTLGIDGLEENVEVYSFSKREDYDAFLRNRFPENFAIYEESNAMFYQSPDGSERFIVNHTPVPHDLSARELAILEQNKKTLKEVLQISRANIYSSLAHELTHLHPFFAVHGNDETANEWEQEKICCFIGEKIRVRQGNTAFRQKCFVEAQDDLKKDGIPDLESAGTDWEDSKKYEDFFYPYLEKRYGIDQIRQLWELLAHEPKHSLSAAIKNIYGKNLQDMEKDFAAVVLAAHSHTEIENI